VALSTLEARTAPEWLFPPSLGPLADGFPGGDERWTSCGGLETLLVFAAPVDPAAAARRFAAAQTFEANAAAIWSRVGAPPSTTTIVTRWTTRPGRVCTVIR
jgi:hypothetical protein